MVQVDGQLKTGRDVRDRRAARRRGVRLRHGAARGLGLHHDARLPPRHLPGRDRHPEPRRCGPSSAGSPSSSRRSSSTSPRRCASSWPSLGLRSLDEAIGRVDLLDTETAVGHWKAAGLDLSPSWPSPTCPTTVGPAPDAAAGPRPREGARPRVPGRCAPALADGTPGVGGAADHQRRPHGRHAARVRDQPAPRGGRAARRHHLADLHRLGRPELRCLRAPGRDDAPATATPTTTSARASRAGASSCGRRSGRPSSPRSRSSPATSSSTAPPAARSSSGARWGSASACATRAPPRWSRAWATTGAST